MKSRVKIKKSPKEALRHLERLNKNLKGRNRVQVGLPKESNTYPDGTSVIMVGAVHEFGSPSRNIPERSYLRSTMVANRRQYRIFMRRLAASVVKGKMDMDKAMGLIGLKLQTDVQRRIETLKHPPLKSREGNPLIDTGHLRQSITYKVSK